MYFFWHGLWVNESTDHGSIWHGLFLKSTEIWMLLCLHLPCYSIMVLKVKVMSWLFWMKEWCSFYHNCKFGTRSPTVLYSILVCSILPLPWEISFVLFLNVFVIKFFLTINKYCYIILNYYWLFHHVFIVVIIILYYHHVAATKLKIYLYICLTSKGKISLLIIILLYWCCKTYCSVRSNHQTLRTTHLCIN